MLVAGEASYSIAAGIFLWLQKAHSMLYSSCWDSLGGWEERLSFANLLIFWSWPAPPYVSSLMFHDRNFDTHHFAQEHIWIWILPTCEGLVTSWKSSSKNSKYSWTPSEAVSRVDGVWETSKSGGSSFHTACMHCAEKRGKNCKICPIFNAISWIIYEKPILPASTLSLGPWMNLWHLNKWLFCSKASCNSRNPQKDNLRLEVSAASLFYVVLGPSPQNIHRNRIWKERNWAFLGWSFL